MPTDIPLYSNIERYSEAFFGEMKAFIDYVKSDKIAPITGEDGRIAVVLSMTNKKLYDENRPIKKL
jgi:hypothetical protein